MFEDLIAQLDEMGVDYEEDTEAGTLTIDISDMDKVELIDVISVLNNTGETFDITETSITVTGGTPTESLPEEGTGEEESTNYMDEALAQM